MSLSLLLLTRQLEAFAVAHDAGLLVAALVRRVLAEGVTAPANLVQPRVRVSAGLFVACVLHVPNLTWR